MLKYNSKVHNKVNSNLFEYFLWGAFHAQQKPFELVLVGLVNRQLEFVGRVESNLGYFSIIRSVLHHIAVNLLGVLEQSDLGCVACASSHPHVFGHVLRVGLELGSVA